MAGLKFLKKVARILFLYYIYCQRKRSGYTGFSVGTEIGECGEVIESDSFFVGCKEMPMEMSSRLDLPWVFIGEIDGGHRAVRCVCRKCEEHASPGIVMGRLVEPMPPLVTCDSYRVLTEDLINLVVYFGWCSECGTVYWGRSGPPFCRVSGGVSV